LISNLVNLLPAKATLRYIDATKKVHKAVDEFFASA
jgi:hypothetical protein